MLRAILLSLVLAGPAAAQTPLCVWSGTGLICPGQPAPSAPTVSTIVPSILPSPEQQLNQLQAQADLDRAVVAAQAEQAQQRASIDRTDPLTIPGVCAGAETVVRENKPGDLAGYAPRCTAAPK